MSIRSVITVKQVKARVWPAHGQWCWTCPACHDGGHALDGNQCHDAARRHGDPHPPAGSVAITQPHCHRHAHSLPNAHGHTQFIGLAGANSAHRAG